MRGHSQVAYGGNASSNNTRLEPSSKKLVEAMEPRAASKKPAFSVSLPPISPMTNLFNTNITLLDPFFTVTTASSHVMEEVEDTLEVHETEFSQVQLETCVSDSTDDFHLMQPLVLDEIDVEVFNEITPAMVITNQDTKPADLLTALAEMPVIEATERQARKSS
ncbi:hypothetical protein QYM36_000555 [Artemia franciscana]|uniref:Uncharacterized protein n=1 Tax=Artemia franciscana TaxID=6661 RepID=A0AA88IST4_ARTSF|nr:hypothetical protein QYM36_000555 [Artemia franciscana]